MKSSSDPLVGAVSLTNGFLPVPKEIGLLTRLQHINFSNNALYGPIPAELGLLDKLQELNLSGNENLERDVPEEVKNLASLIEIKVDSP